MQLRIGPEEIAGKLKSNLFEKIETAAPGFINFFLSKEYLQKQVREILKEKDSFGKMKIGKGKKVNVEFISANPTGPLTLGNGRGGFYGDVLTNVLKKAGFKAEREYYVNDGGEQIRKLGHSVIGDSQAVYKGSYIEALRKRIKENDPEKAGKKAAKIILEEMIKPSIRKMGIKFDTFFYESELYKKKEVEKILKELSEKNLSYIENGAIFASTANVKGGDEKDRVLKKSSGEETYLASDIAYLKNKTKRRFDILIYIWGADHYGYIERIKWAASEFLKLDKNKVKFIIMQLVRLFEKGKEVRMSKRAGIFVTMDELIGEVGLDATRFFFLSRAVNTHLNFNLDLAREQSEKNPIYYIQYAYARICSIIKKSKIKIDNKYSSLHLLQHPSELNLIKQLIKFPEIVEDTAKDYQVQRLPQYALDLATTFHAFYGDCRVISEEKKLTQARLSLVLAAKIVLKNTLDLMGISAPQKM